MRKKFRNRHIASLILIACMLMSVLPSFGLPVMAEETSPNITINVKTNTDPSIISTVSGSSISVALSSVTPSKITSLEVTGGQVTAEDWNYIQTNKESFTALTDLIVDVAVTSVANIPPAVKGIIAFPSSLQTVDIANVKNIGDGAFNSCLNLTNANFPDVISIGEFAFIFCSSLKNISAPKVTTIGKQGFYQCSSITDITFNNITIINDDTFTGCTSIITANFLDVTSIGSVAFAFCTNLTTVNFPEVINIGSNAFAYCTSLKNMSFPKTTMIEYRAFEECTSITDITFNAVDTMLFNAFSGCIKLTSATFPVATNIGPKAFSNCTSLITIELPATPPVVYNDTFTGGASIRNLVLLDENGIPLSGVDLTTAQNKYKLIEYDGNITDNSWYGWTVVPPTLISSVTISGIAQEGQILTATVDPSGATVNYQWKVGGSSVGYNSATYAVQGADFTKTITVTATGTSNYSGVVQSTTTSPVLLTSFLTAKINGTTVDGASLSNLISRSGIALNKITSIEILRGPSFTAADWEYMFNNCAYLSQLSEFIILDDVTTVVRMPELVMGRHLDITTLQNVEIANISEIGNSAFYYCRNLTTAIFPDLINIGESAFAGCAKLTTATFPTLTVVKAYAFSGCTSLKNILFTNTGIIKDHGFSGCTSFLDITFHAATIEVDAFKDCTNLTSLSLPNAWSIDLRAFSNCPSLETLKLRAIPPTVYVLYDDAISTKSLAFVDTSGTPLSGIALTMAQNAYKIINDGNKTDNLWYGWKVVPSIPLSSITISGVAQAGQTLTAKADPSGATVNYQWQADNINIGTNSASYTVQVDDIGKEITVIATGTDFYGDSVTSLVTSSVIAAEPLIIATIKTATDTIGTSFGGETLSDAVSKAVGAAYNTITSIEITGGTVTSNDWIFITNYTGYFTNLTNLKVVDTVDVVENIPDRETYICFPISLQTVDVAKVKIVGDFAFYLSKIETANFPDATSIGDKTFYGCKNLLEISFARVENIGLQAFFECIALEEVILPKVKTIDSQAFADSTSLITFKFGAIPPEVKYDSFTYTVNYKGIFFIDESGNDLAGAAFTSAQKAYEEVYDGYGTTNSWFSFYLGPIAAVKTDVILAKYTKDQLFDVQRSAAFPLAGQMFRLNAMNAPYNQNLLQISWETGDYVKFEFVKTFSELDTTTKNKIINSLKWYYSDLNTLNNAAVIKEVHYSSNGTIKSELSSIGIAWTIDAKEGFLYTALDGTYGGSGGIGTFVSFQPHVYGSGTAYIAVSSNPLTIGQLNAFTDVTPEDGSYVELAQEKTYVISGILVDKKDNSTPIENATITIITDHDNKTYTGTTDASGNYAIEVIYKDTDKDYSLNVTTTEGTSPAISGTIDNTIGFGTDDNSVTIPYIDTPINSIVIDPNAIGESPQWHDTVSAGGITVTTEPLEIPTTGSVALKVNEYVAGNTYYRVLSSTPTAQFVGQVLQGNWKKLGTNGATISATDGSFVEIVTVDNLQRIQNWGVISAAVIGIPTYTVSGTIKDTNNNPVSGATVVLTSTTDNTKKYTATTNVNGVYTISDVPNGGYASVVTKNSENLGSGSVTVNSSNVSGGSGNIAVTPPTVPTPAVPTPTSTPTSQTEEITVDVKIGSSNEVASVVTVQRTTETNGRKTDTIIYQDENVKETIEKLNEEGKNVARIVIPDAKDEISETNVKIPTTSLELIAASNINLEIDTKNARISIPKETIQNANTESMEELYFSIIPITNVEEKAQVIERAKKEAVVLELVKDSTMLVIGTPMTIETNMPSSLVDITLPLYGVVIPTVVKEREEFLSKLAVYIEHNDGEKVLVRGEIVDYEEGVLGIKFSITKFSTFTIIKADSLVQKSNECEIEAKSPSATTMKGTKLSLTVKYNTTKTKVNVTISEDATWKLYSDMACKKEITNKYMSLKVGANKAYIKVTAEDGSSAKVYTITVTRSKKVVAAENVFFIATNIEFSDAYAAEVLAKQLGGSVKTFGYSEKEIQKIITYVTKNLTTKDTIYIIGLEKAIKTDVEKILTAKGYKNIIRIGGDDKYETAKKIADSINPQKGTKVVLVNGDKMPNDGANINKKCAEKGYPILYVNTDSLTQYTIEALKDIKPSEIYIVGDKTQISNKVVKELQRILGIETDNLIRIVS